MTSTRSTSAEDRMAALEVSNHGIKRQLDSHQEEFVGICNSIEALVDSIAQMGKEHVDDAEGNSVSQPRSSGAGGSVQTRFSQIDFPHFSSEDPMRWIYKVEKFFRYQRTAANERVVLASFHLQDDALQWYRWFEKARPNITWEEFTQALCVCFGPTNYEDFDEALAKLQQIGTVREYQTQLERLVTRVQDWPEKALVGSYIGGLKEEIRSKVKLFRPTSLLHAASLAKLHEKKLQRQRRGVQKLDLLPMPSPKPTTTPITTTKPTPRTRFKRLTWAEMQARREKGLCFNCDEKFALGHKCKLQQAFLIEVVEESEDGCELISDDKEEERVAIPEISLHALSGISTP